MALVFNRASDNYLFHGSQFKAGNTRDFLRLSTANNEAVIDLCNNSNIDISATDVFINGNKVVTSSGTSGPTLGSLDVTGTTVLQDLTTGATDISSTLNVDGLATFINVTIKDGANDLNIASHDGTNGLKLAGTLVTSTAAELNYVDVTPGTAAASKALVLDSNKDVGSIRNLSIDGVFTDGNYIFDTNGNVSGLGTVGCGAITSSGNLEVTGTTVLQDLSAGATDISSTLNVDGATTLSSTLAVSGATTLSGAIDANSTADIADTLTLSKGSGTGLSVTADASVGGTLDVTGAVQIGSGANGSLTIGSGSHGGKIHSTITPHELVIDPFALDANGSIDASGVVTILGDLVVRGNTTTFHSENVDVSKNNLTLASGATSAGMADGAGITVGNDAFATFTFDSYNTKWATNIDLDVSGNTAVAGTLAVTGATTLTGALGATTINASAAVGVDGDFDVATDKFTVASATGNTAVAGTLDVSGATTLTGALGATTINASAAVGVDGDFDVATDKFTVASATGNTAVAGTLDVASKITTTGGLDISGHLLPTTNDTQIPVTMSTFTREIGNSIQTQDLSAIGGVDSITYQDATNWSITRTVLSGHSYIKMEFKANFISSPEFDQTLSFRVVRSLNGGVFDESNPVFEDTEIGSNMGVTIRGVYNGTYIDDLAGGLTAGQSVAYKLQVKRNKALGDTIQTAFGIVLGGNYMFLQELYQPNA